jgi:pimeloyl-ACP methyl ester carboxylesterase
VAPVSVYCEVSGEGDDLLVLLHGMGATGDIWSPLVAARPAGFGGRVLLLDLPGHGASERLDSYAMAAVTAAVAAAIRDHLAPAGRYRLLGHSYGGVVALELGAAAAQGAGRTPDFIYGLGIKSVWRPEEIEGMRGLAGKPPRQFPDAVSARERYLKVSGLAVLGEVGAQCGARGTVQTRQGLWQLAVDPRVYAITPPHMERLARANRGRFALAYGADDEMVDAADLARHDPQVAVLPGGGHNIMVDRPGAVWDWIS